MVKFASDVNKAEKELNKVPTVKADVTVAHNYSTHHLNSTELGKEKLRQMLAQVSKIRGTPKSYRRNKDKFYTPNTQIHDRSLSWHGTGTSIKRGRVKLVLWAQTSPLHEMMWSCSIYFIVFIEIDKPIFNVLETHLLFHQ